MADCWENCSLVPRLPADDGCATGGEAPAILSDSAFESAPAGGATAGAAWVFAAAIPLSGNPLVTSLWDSVAPRPCRTPVDEANASASAAGVAAVSILI